MDYDIAVWSLIVLIVKSNADKLSKPGNEIDTRISSSPKEQAVYFTAEINQPLRVDFQNISAVIERCTDFYDNTTTLEASFGLSKIHIQNVTYHMSTVWRCKLVTMNFDPKGFLLHNHFILFMTLHVKGAKSVEVSVNDQDVTFSGGDLSVPYDGNTDYIYEDGEVHIVCKNPHSTGSVRLDYFANDTMNLGEFEEIESALYIQLSSSDNQTFIECLYRPDGYDDKYKYRVTFFTKKPSDSSNEIKTLSDAMMTSPVLLGSSIGAVFVLLALAGVAYYYAKTRNARHIENPYENILAANNYENSISQINEYENRYDTCYEAPKSAEDMIKEENNYTKIDYAHCKPKICEKKIRKNLVYDEPYVHIDNRNITYVNITRNHFCGQSNKTPKC